MPIMQVHYPAGGLDDARKADLARRLTAVLVRMEGDANTHGGRAFASVLFSEMPHADWWVGGEVDDSYVSPPGRFLVRVTIPEGYMNTAHKNEVHAWVAESILAATAPPNAGSATDEVEASGRGASILVVIDEVTEGNWSAAGRPISLETIADSVGLSKSGERFGWSKMYFEAKARMLAAAGFPRDVGGLLPSQRAGRGS